VNKRQLITLWVTGVAISLIAIVVVADWEHTKYPFYLFITASLPVLIIGALLYYTLGKVEYPLRWFHRRRKILLSILILLTATYLALWAMVYTVDRRDTERRMARGKERFVEIKALGVKIEDKAEYLEDLTWMSGEDFDKDKAKIKAAIAIGMKVRIFDGVPLLPNGLIDFSNLPDEPKRRNKRTRTRESSMQIAPAEAHFLPGGRVDFSTVPDKQK